MNRRMANTTGRGGMRRCLTPIAPSGDASRSGRIPIRPRVAPRPGIGQRQPRADSGITQGWWSMTMATVSMIWPPRARALCALLAWATISLGSATAIAQDDAAAADETAAAPPATVLSADEIRKLVAPVALYPDD